MGVEKSPITTAQHLQKKQQKKKVCRYYFEARNFSPAAADAIGYMKKVTC